MVAIEGSGGKWPQRHGGIADSPPTSLSRIIMARRHCMMRVNLLILLAGLLVAWTSAAQVFIRQGDRIVDAPESDQKVAGAYTDYKDKGEVNNGKRITILTAKTEYEVGEEIRVIHVLEIINAGAILHIMGPKTVDEEYVDGTLADPKGPDENGYDGRVMKSPGVDCNYEVTTYRFTEPGTHTIQWRGGGELVSHRYGRNGSLGLKSNTLTIRVKARK
jgi:hypothetical protein